jgi:hypothetical protein
VVVEVIHPRCHSCSIGDNDGSLRTEAELLLSVT